MERDPYPGERAADLVFEIDKKFAGEAPEDPFPNRLRSLLAAAALKRA